MKKNMLLITLFITGLLANAGSLFAAAAAPVEVVRPTDAQINKAREEAVAAIRKYIPSLLPEEARLSEIEYESKLIIGYDFLKILQQLKITEDNLHELLHVLYNLSSSAVGQNVIEYAKTRQPYVRSAVPLTEPFQALNHYRNLVLEKIEKIINESFPDFAQRLPAAPGGPR